MDQRILATAWKPAARALALTAALIVPPRIALAASGPDPDTERAFHKLLDSFVAGRPDYADMDPRLADAVRQHPEVATGVSAFGSVQSVTYKGEQNGGVLYSVRQAKGTTEWSFTYKGGKVVGLLVRPAP